jgi:hypothetical protein
MPRIYTHLTTQERAVVMTMRDDQWSIRSMLNVYVTRRAPASAQPAAAAHPCGQKHQLN